MIAKCMTTKIGENAAARKACCGSASRTRRYLMTASLPVQDPLFFYFGSSESPTAANTKGASPTDEWLDGGDKNGNFICFKLC